MEKVSVIISNFRYWVKKKYINIAKGTLLLVLNSVVVYYLFHYLLEFSQLSSTYAVILQYTPWAVLVIGIILSYFFNSSRIFFILLLILMMQINIEKVPTVSNHIQFGAIIGALYLLLPLNLMAFSFFKERGIISLWGIAKIIFIGAQYLLVYAWLSTRFEKEYLLKRLTNNAILYNIFKGDSLSKILFLIFLISLVFLVYKSKKIIDYSFTSVLVTLFISSFFLYEHTKEVVYIFFLMGGLLLNTGIIVDAYLMAYRDGLTGLPSRRALKAALMRLGNRYTVAMLDIDHFKNFNDQYGHDVGDQVLKLLATYLKGIKGGGKIYRYGGEEFTIIFPGKNKEEVIPHLEELRKKVAGRVFIIRNKKPTARRPEDNYYPITTPAKERITISIGVAQKDSRHKNPEEVLKAADKALYISKFKGRNCITSF